MQHPITESCVMCFLPFGHNNFIENGFKQVFLHKHEKSEKCVNTYFLIYTPSHLSAEAGLYVEKPDGKEKVFKNVKAKEPMRLGVTLEQWLKPGLSFSHYMPKLIDRAS